ncbi:MAG: sugar phosphate isomerase/epimerase family protein [Christensenellales bacterium]|jgi:sugar phosphate isomerase/epimerase
MNESIEQFFRVGLVAAMAYPEEYPNHADKVCARIAKDAFFSVVELNPIPNPTTRARVAQLLDEAHMDVFYGAQARLLSKGLNPNSLDERERQEAENALIESVEEAQELHAKGIAFLSGHWTEDNRVIMLNQLVRTTVNVCRRAAAYGMTCELEVFDYDIAKRALVGPAELAALYAEKVRESCQNFGLLVDLSHIPMCHEQPRDVIRILRPYITHFHIGNTVCRNPKAPAYGDEHPRFGFPGSENDTAELVEFLLCLKNEGFLRADAPMMLSFEVKPRPEEDPDIILAAGKRVLRHAWAMV